MAILLASCAGPITGVSVRNANFDVVKTLTPSELPEFTRLWDSKEQVDVERKKVGGTHFKLDIMRTNRDGRWLYWSTGYVWLLDVFPHPVYRIREPEAFNRLIGALE